MHYFLLGHYHILMKIHTKYTFSKIIVLKNQKKTIFIKKSRHASELLGN